MDRLKIEYNENTLEDLKKIYLSVKKDNNRVVENNQRISDGIQDILHYIELKTFNVPEGYFMIMDLKELLMEKRENLDKKKELLELASFFKGEASFEDAEKKVNDIKASNKQSIVSIINRVKDVDKESCAVNFEYLVNNIDGFDSFAILLGEMMKQYNDRRNELKQAMSKIEKNINLLLDKIEFDRFGLIEGYKYAKAIKNLRQERRKIKNEFDRYIYLDAILLNNPKIEKLVEKMEKQETIKQSRKYSPRVIKSLGVMN